MGTGKTFLTTCFAGEVGIPAVMLKNFRSMWQGVTEANLERVLTLLKAMSPIAVVVDEADAQLGTRSNFGDSGVSSRVFAQIAQFMGNTEYRGKVIWFLLTCRPDLLPVDLKRQGRAEEHIALVLSAYRRGTAGHVSGHAEKGWPADPASEEAEKFFLDNAGTLSGADTEAVLVRARMKSALEGDAEMDIEDLKAAIADFIPGVVPDRDRIAESGCGAGVYLQEPAAAAVSRHGSRRDPAPRRRTRYSGPISVELRGRSVAGIHSHHDLYLVPQSARHVPRIRDAIRLCVEVEGAPEQELEFVGIQRVIIEA